MDPAQITDLLRRWGAGDEEVLQELMPVVYSSLRTLAHQRLRGTPHEHSLNTTDLVHEAYLRFVQSFGAAPANRNHFLGLASRVMRSVLVDRARARAAHKRGGGSPMAELHEETWVGEVDLDRVAELHEALTRLEELDERQARMIEQRYFGGLSLEEIARVMDVSLATVKRDLRSARAWLATDLGTA